ncbi:unnamed protein product [Plutella xylostella]|uniref:(diamondback moth) hypothetical protein n=1 Tax=Plutella xylostella TaxID=51655 RepID=A0A8S4DAI1_PLUXY|nr:unnamed protein product [Plutella xylostella]
MRSTNYFNYARAPLEQCITQVPEYGVGARVIWAMSAGDREAEAQAKKGEEGPGNERDSKAAAALKVHWCVSLRVVELVSQHKCCLVVACEDA